MPVAATAIAGPSGTCPHCGARAGIAAGSDGPRCRLCGGPVVATDPAVRRSGAEKPALVRAKRAQAQRALTGLTAGLATALGAVLLVTLGLVLWLGDPSGAASATLGGATLLVVAWAMLGWRRVGRTTTAVQAALTQARATVAHELLASQPDLSPVELSRLLGLSPEQAEQLLAEQQVEDFLAEGTSRGPAEDTVAQRFRVLAAQGPPEEPKAAAEAEPEGAREPRRQGR